MKKLLLVSALAGLAPLMAQAESQLVAPAPANATATARVDFRITIPRSLFLRVGTGTDFANNPTIDLIDFVVPAGNIGDGTVVNATAGGDISAGVVTVRVKGNGGDVSLNSNTTGPLNTGVVGAPTIGWDQISVAAAPHPVSTTGFTNTGIAHPAFNTGATGGAGTAVPLTATGKLVRQEGQWKYAYLNANLVPAGVYGGVNTNNGRVSYTASMP
jgi:hypothetical protein